MQQSITQGATQKYRNKSLNSPHKSPASCVFASASAALGHKRNPPCSLQLRLARVTKEKVSAVKHSCSAQKQLHNQPPGWQLLSRVGRTEKTGGRQAKRNFLRMFLHPVWAGRINILQICVCVCYSDLISQDEPIEKQTVIVALEA